MASAADANDNDFSLDLDLDGLNITTEQINFDEIDDDLERFQEDEMVQQALQRGVDLKKYGRELEKELKEAEMASVSQYMDNRQSVLDLHRQINDCDEVLLRMQEMLGGFQSDLGGISEEIRHLQEESFSMNIRLKNRRVAEELLHHFLENASISPDVITRISEGAVDEAFLEAVVDLASKLHFTQQTKPAKDGSSLDVAPRETISSQLLLPELERLRAVAVAKSRDYFLGQFAALRRPKTNVHILQQSSLIRYAPLFQFLQAEAGPIADDLRSIYVESMGKTVFNLFKNYYAQLLRLDSGAVAKGDLIAVEEAALKNVFAAATKQGTPASKKGDVFALGDRVLIIEQVEAAPAILVHVANAEAQRFPCEVIWRSVVKHLVDAATNEFLFVVDFFKTAQVTTFNAIFTRTLNHLISVLEAYLGGCHDMLGLLLMIKVSHAQRLIMQRRRIPVLDSFFDRMSLLLWPKFKAIFDVNLRAMRDANLKRLGSVSDLAPHYVCRRYAEFVASIITLQGSSAIGGSSGGGSSYSSGEADGDGGGASSSDSLGIGGGGELMLQHDLGQLRMEMINLLEKLASTSITTNNRDRKVFFINNLDAMLHIFQERRVQSDEVARFEELLLEQREQFVEEQLAGCFPRLIAFVLETERLLMEEGGGGGNSAAGGRGKASSSALKGTVDEKRVEGLVKEFAASWRGSIQQINDDVLQYFGNLRNGMEILKQVLTQLLLYYSRFQDIIKKAFARPPEFTRDIVSTATILMEIKRYSRTF